MMDWNKVLVSPFTPIKEVIQIIDASALQIALVSDEKKRLLGTVTDGDVRRAILKGVPLENVIKDIMNASPITASEHQKQDEILELMRLTKIRHLPIVGNDGEIIDIRTIDDFIVPVKKDNWVVLMAGGLGTRLSPLTDEVPKPLLKVGSRPILETIISTFIKQGFLKFYLSVNYKADMIIDYFGDGSQFGAEIKYIYENKRMGTAGALSLLPEKPKKPIIVMNGDLLTKVDFSLLMNFHDQNHSLGTMCVREFDYQIPYGVVKLNEQKLIGIEEKPIQKSFVSAGIYVLSPGALDFVPADEFYDMPKLFEKLIDKNKSTCVFPIREYWLDIGRTEDYNRANQEFEEVFS